MTTTGKTRIMIGGATLAWKAASTQIRFTALSLAQRDEENARRELQTLESAIQYFRRRQTELVAVEDAKKKGIKQKPWWQIYMSMYERSLLEVDHRASAAPGHPALDLERAANALQLRMEMFANVYYRRLGHLGPNSPTEQNRDPFQNLAEAYEKNDWSRAEIKQLESDMRGLRTEFLNALKECEQKVAHYRTQLERASARVKELMR
jgi:hypothetical protein